MMSAWRDLIEEVEDRIKEDFDPTSRYNSDLLHEIVDGAVPQSYADLLEVAGDNLEVINYETEFERKTAHDIMQEAIYHLLSEEAYTILGKLEDDVEVCDQCREKFLPNTSDADDSSFCSSDCEFKYNAIECEMCHNDYLEGESNADEPDRFCDEDCEHEYNSVNCKECNDRFVPEDSSAVDTDSFCCSDCEDTYNNSTS